jgi:non-specific serine/threonine protein kinase
MDASTGGGNGRDSNGTQDRPNVLYRYRFGSAQFDESRFELKVDGVVVDVERRALEVLNYLLRHAGEAVTKTELLDEVWAGRITVEKVLPNAVTKLRAALGKHNASLIQNLPRVGYLISGVSERVAVGRQFRSQLELAAGNPLPGREHFTLRAPLSVEGAREVWLVEHTKTREKRVCKFAKDGEELAALKREVTLYRVLRQSLGDRPDLVRILDWNFSELPFYLESEYGGPSLLEWSRTDDQLAALSLGQRIELLLQIADVVAAAHDAGVLHKDLKPANVLMVRGPEGWSIRLGDFGSGSLLHPHRLEALGITSMLPEDAPAEMVTTSGTAYYLAPELLAGHPPTAQSDLYALGVMLYQLVAGDLRRPIAPGWEQDVPDALLREDIAAATDGAPGRRLASVAELSRRLRSLTARRRGQEAEEAARERAQAVERALERSRMQRPWIAALLACLTVGLTVSVLLYRQALRAAEQARQESRRAEAVQRFVNEDLLKSADPTAPGAIANPSLQDVLARATERLHQRFEQNADTRGAVALTLGDAYFGIGDYTRAIGLQRQSVDWLSASLGGRNPLTLSARLHLVRSLDRAAQFDAAQAELDRLSVEAAVAIQADPELALLDRWTRGGHAVMRFDPAAALVEFEQLERLRLQHAPEDLLWLLRTREDLAWCYVRLGRSAEAVEALQPLLGEHLSFELAGALDWAKARFTYALALKNLGRYAEAEASLQRSGPRLAQALGPDHFLVGLNSNYLASVYLAQARWSAALDAENAALRIYRSVLGEAAPATEFVQGMVGVIQAQLGQPVGYLTLERALNGFERQGGDSPFAQYLRYQKARLLLDAGDAAAARRLLDRVQAEALNTVEPGEDWSAQLQALRQRLPSPG